MNLLLLPYFFVTWGVGWAVLSTWFNRLPTLLSVVGAVLLGIGLSIPVTYVLTVLFAATHDPMLYGVITYILLSGSLLLIWKRNAPKSKRQSIPLSEIILAVLVIGFSTWVMSKTFHGDAAGQLFVGSNNIFDSSYLVGLVRSMSWGANIPFGSPYFAGLPLFYHFFFVFWVALLEHFGTPLAWAVNIPGTLTFSALLLVVYFLPQLIAKQKPIVGWIAVLLTVTNSTLTFLHVPLTKDIWRLATYPFAGPFDGSVISIFMTLNNYVNQRHLAFAVALGLFLYLLAERSISQKTITARVSVVLGIAVGMLFLWNMAIFALTLGVVALLLLLNRKWKHVAAFIAGAAAISLVSVTGFMPFLYRAALFINSAFIKSSYGSYAHVPSWNIGTYLWQNLGILPVVVALGFLVLPKKNRLPFVPLLIAFVGLCFFAVVGNRGFDQKFLSFLIIGVNALAACGVHWLWVRRTLIARAGAVIAIIVLSLSGFIDLMPIKNEFAYPILDRQTVPVVEWIHKNTPKESIFVSYADMIDPVVIAGRTNYFGFYGNVGWFDRSASVSRIYGGDSKEAKIQNISYVLVPKWDKNDFPYEVDIEKLREVYAVAYEDDRYILFKI